MSNQTKQTAKPGKTFLQRIKIHYATPERPPVLPQPNKRTVGENVEILQEAFRQGGKEEFEKKFSEIFPDQVQQKK